MRFVYSPVGGSEALRGRVTHALQPAAVVRGAANTPHAGPGCSPALRRSRGERLYEPDRRPGTATMRRPRDVGSRLRGRPGTARGPFSPPKQVGPVAVDPCREPRVVDQLPGAVELREVRQRPPADEEAAVGGRLGVALRGGRELFGLIVGGQQGRRSCALVELDRDRAAGGQQRVARGLIIEPRVEAVAECLWVVLPGEQLSRIPVERQRRDIGARPWPI